MRPPFRMAVPEELMAATSRPVSLVWGEADPWEDAKEGRRLFANLPSVVEFVTLPGVRARRESDGVQAMGMGRMVVARVGACRYRGICGAPCQHAVALTHGPAAATSAISHSHYSAVLYRYGVHGVPRTPS
jgi:hypothetical protein